LRKKLKNKKIISKMDNLVAMGFEPELVSAALRQSGGSFENALELLLNGAVVPAPIVQPLTVRTSFILNFHLLIFDM
jgi:hypothetical protein